MVNKNQDPCCFLLHGTWLYLEYEQPFFSMCNGSLLLTLVSYKVSSPDVSCASNLLFTLKFKKLKTNGTTVATMLVYKKEIKILGNMILFFLAKPEKCALDLAKASYSVMQQSMFFIREQIFINTTSFCALPGYRRS